MTYNREEIDEVHEQMLSDFIQNAQDLEAMILIGFRNVDEGTSRLEISMGGSRQNVYRAIAGMLEALVEGSKQGKIANKNEAIACAKLADIFSRMAGDDPDDMEFEGSEEFVMRGKKN